LYWDLHKKDYLKDFSGTGFDIKEMYMGKKNTFNHINTYSHFDTDTFWGIFQENTHIYCQKYSLKLKIQPFHE